jgi:hypothetical protein
MTYRWAQKESNAVSLRRTALQIDFESSLFQVVLDSACDCSSAFLLRLVCLASTSESHLDCSCIQTSEGPDLRYHSVCTRAISAVCRPGGRLE